MLMHNLQYAAMWLHALASAYLFFFCIGHQHENNNVEARIFIDHVDVQYEDVQYECMPTPVCAWRLFMHQAQLQQLCWEQFAAGLHLDKQI